MDARNDVSKVTEIPIELGKFQSCWWGRHHPPYIKAGKIIFDVGVGYKSSSRLHGQNIYVIDVDGQKKMALIAVTKYGHIQGAGNWMYLIGINSTTPWICQVPVRLLSVTDAVAYLQSKAVKPEEQTGLKVLRQNDWFFVPVAEPER